MAVAARPAGAAGRAAVVAAARLLEAVMAEAELTRAGPASIARERRTPARCGGRRCEMRSGGGGGGGGGGGYSTYSTTPLTSKSSENEMYSVSREGGGDEARVAIGGAAGAVTSAMTLALA